MAATEAKLNSTSHKELSYSYFSDFVVVSHVIVSAVLQMWNTVQEAILIPHWVAVAKLTPVDLTRESHLQLVQRGWILMPHAIQHCSKR